MTSSQFEKYAQDAVRFYELACDKIGDRFAPTSKHDAWVVQAYLMASQAASLLAMNMPPMLTLPPMGDEVDLSQLRIGPGQIIERPDQGFSVTGTHRSAPILPEEVGVRCANCGRDAAAPDVRCHRILVKAKDDSGEMIRWECELEEESDEH